MADNAVWKFIIVGKKDQYALVISPCLYCWCLNAGDDLCIKKEKTTKNLLEVHGWLYFKVDYWISRKNIF